MYVLLGGLLIVAIRVVSALTLIMIAVALDILLLLTAHAQLRRVPQQNLNRMRLPFNRNLEFRKVTSLGCWRRS